MKKRAMTLLEIMVVIFLITLITGVVGYNLKGSMDKGRAFKTKQGKEQLHDLLLLCMEEPDNGNVSFEEILKDPQKYIKKAGLAKDPKSMVVDGWGKPYRFVVKNANNREFQIESDALMEYEKKKK